MVLLSIAVLPEIRAILVPSDSIYLNPAVYIFTAAVYDF
jgi:hypothetical protein